MPISPSASLPERSPRKASSTSALHPGKRLAGLLRTRRITAYRCATDMGVPKPRIYELIKEQGSVTPALALRLGLYFGDGAEAWMAAQARYDLKRQARELRTELQAITPLEQLQGAA